MSVLGRLFRRGGRATSPARSVAGLSPSVSSHVPPGRATPPPPPPPPRSLGAPPPPPPPPAAPVPTVGEALVAPGGTGPKPTRIRVVTADGVIRELPPDADPDGRLAYLASNLLTPPPDAP